jgi:hypothetical protein
MRLLPLLAVIGYLRAYATQALKEAVGDLRSARPGYLRAYELKELLKGI